MQIDTQKMADLMDEIAAKETAAVEALLATYGQATRDSFLEGAVEGAFQAGRVQMAKQGALMMKQCATPSPGFSKAMVM